MLRIVESVASLWEVEPLEGHTFEQILHMLQKDRAQTLTDPDSGERGIYVPTPRQHPGVKKIAALRPTKEQQRIITYGRD